MTIIISRKNPNGDNIDITPRELAFIRSLEDFDLTMFISEVEDLGWEYGRRLLVAIGKSIEAAKEREGSH